ncbi:ATP-binding protein [Planococcus glaciei]|uniref:ATP-binding protein n=1 Tax=Planococcus glaciei TaxID=459472 RepID=UPI00128D2BF5
MAFLIILTSNKSFIECRKVFEDKVWVTAVLDFLLHHFVNYNIKGDFYHRKK